MSIVHFTTEVSGGAGGFVRRLHQAMLEKGLPSKVITRQPSDVREAYVVKPMGRLKASLRSWILEMKCRLGLLDASYAMFGIEPDVLDVKDIETILQGSRPQAFIFYWISYFVSFETIAQLRSVYPGVPIVFMLTDEAFLTGGCHYSHGCLGYEKSCSNCPAVSLKSLRKKVEQGFVHRAKLIREMDPLVIYPTTNILEMGRRSAAMGSARAKILPLGAISIVDQQTVLARRKAQDSKEKKKVSLLVRSSHEYRKGSDLLVEALRIMDRSHPNLNKRLRVMSIGDDALVQAGIDQYVEHQSLGFVNRSQLLSLYGEVDAFIVTSREDGGPLMTNECVASGVFVISTPIGVARDLIVDGANGLITADISSASIADALANFIQRHGVEDNAIDDGQNMSRLRGSLTFEGYIQNLMQVISDESRYESNEYSPDARVSNAN